MKAPFPYFGGKSRVADIVWERFGDTPNYVEPFFGSGAVLLSRPDSHDWAQRIETVNDADGLLSNFWRAVQAEPEAVAHWADWPVNENDLHARHCWLVGRKESLQARLEGDADFYDAKAAGWWVWGISAWIGSGWCNTNGPWVQHDGELVNKREVRLEAEGVSRQMPHLGDKGRGVHRQALHVYETMQALSTRLRRVRVCCGDWSRVMGPTPTIKNGMTAIFLDPPYSHDIRVDGIYTTDTDCARDVLQWCIDNGDNPKLRICLCGYDGEHNALEQLGWTVYSWKAAGGYGSQSNGRGNANAHRERLWFSPHCLHQDAGTFTLAIEGGIL